MSSYPPKFIIALIPLLIPGLLLGLLLMYLSSRESVDILLVLWSALQIVVLVIMGIISMRWEMKFASYRSAPAVPVPAVRVVTLGRRRIWRFMGFHGDYRADSASSNSNSRIGLDNFSVPLVLSLVTVAAVAALGLSSCVTGDDIAPIGDSPAVTSCGDPPKPEIPIWHFSQDGLEIMMPLESSWVIHDWYRDSVRWMACAEASR